MSSRRDRAADAAAERTRSAASGIGRLAPPAGWALAICLVVGATGCSGFRSLDGVPVESLSPAFRTPVRSGLSTVDLTLLRRTPPPQHRVDAGDVLAVYIEGVLGTPDQEPPVSASTLPLDRPSVGYPIEVREDGTLALPAAGAVYVRGLTLPEVEAKLRREFTESRPLLRTGTERVLVSLQRPRTHSVLVIRQESGNRQGNIGSAATVNFELDKRGTGRIVELPVPQNDVLHALAATGGLPGLDAENVIYVLRRPRYQPLPPGFAPAERDDRGDREPNASPPRTDEPAAPGEPNADDAVSRSAAPRAIVRGQSPDGPRYALPPGFTLNPPPPAPAPPAPVPVPAPALTAPPTAPAVSTRPAPLAVSDRASFPARASLLARAAARRMSVRPAPAPAPAPATSADPLPAPAPIPMGEAGEPSLAPSRANPVGPARPRSFGPALSEPSVRRDAPSRPSTNRSPADRMPIERVPAERRPADGFGLAAAACTADCLSGAHAFPPFPAPGRSTMAGPEVLRIPVRLRPGSPVPFTEEDVTLYDGDIVFVEQREADVFFTAGLLGGGQYQLPQNYDIDVLEALSIVRERGGSDSNAPLSVGGPSSLNQDVTVGASKLIILRKDPLGGELKIEVDLEDALRNPASRVLVRPDDYLVLRYTKCEAYGAFFERLVFDSLLDAIAGGLFFNINNN